MFVHPPTGEYTRENKLNHTWFSLLTSSASSPAGTTFVCKEKATRWANAQNSPILWLFLFKMKNVRFKKGYCSHALLTLPVAHIAVVLYRGRRDRRGSVSQRHPFVRSSSVTVEETVGPMPSAQVRAQGEALFTDFHGMRAAWMEAAATRGRDQAGNLASPLG